MWTKIFHILCLYSVVVQRAKPSKIDCRYIMNELSWCDLTSTYFSNDKNISVEYQLQIASYNSIQCKSENFETQIFNNLDTFQINNIESLCNPSIKNKNNCEKYVEEIISTELKSVKQIEILKLKSMNNLTLDFIAQHYPNVKELEWKAENSCEPAIKLFCKLKSIEYVRMYIALNHKCTNINYNCTTQVKEIEVKLLNNMDFYLLSTSSSFLTGMDNLKLFRGECVDRSQRFPLIGYQMLRNISELVFKNCRDVYIDDESFQYLPNLKSLRFQNVENNYINFYSFLRSEILINNLECLELTNSLKGIYKHLDYLVHYKKLGIIYVSAIAGEIDTLHIPQNVSAFLCSRDMNNNKCIFVVDILKRRCPKECECFLHYNEMVFNVSCVGHKELEYVPIPIIGNTTLYIHNINLTTVPNNSVYGYSKVSELHLANNNLTQISVNQLPPNLTYLDISNNNLNSLDTNVLQYLRNRSGSIRVRLSGNPWICSCEYREMNQFVADNLKMIEDVHKLICREEHLGLMTSLKVEDLCGKSINYTDIILKCLLGIAVSINVVLIFLKYFKKRIAMWLYENKLCLSCIVQPETEQEKVQKFDAFLAFCHKDLNLIEEFVDILEKGPCQHKLCFYQRDWLIGESIAICIMKTIEDSKRIIILMTGHFVNSKWGHFEFRQAIKATSMDPTKRLIVIVYPEVKNFDNLDTELQLYMKFNTYLERNDPLFWRKLLFAMPHRCGEAAPTDLKTEESIV